MAFIFIVVLRTRKRLTSKDVAAVKVLKRNLENNMQQTVDDASATSYDVGMSKYFHRHRKCLPRLK
jgi:hypothetical protein